MKAPKSRHCLSFLNGRSVHAGLVGHELTGLPVHITVRIQILVMHHLVRIDYGTVHTVCLGSEPRSTVREWQQSRRAAKSQIFGAHEQKLTQMGKQKAETIPL
jgi:hypothetical protein